MRQLNESELDLVSGGIIIVGGMNRSGSELGMISLQSLVSQRSTALQLVTGMMNAMGDSTKAIAGNVGR